MFSDDSLWQLYFDHDNTFVSGRQVTRVEPVVPQYATIPKDTLFRVVVSTTGEYPPISLWTPDGIQV